MNQCIVLFIIKLAFSHEKFVVGVEDLNGYYIPDRVTDIELVRLDM